MARQSGWSNRRFDGRLSAVFAGKVPLVSLPAPSTSLHPCSAYIEAPPSPFSWVLWCDACYMQFNVFAQAGEHNASHCPRCDNELLEIPSTGARAAHDDDWSDGVQVIASGLF